MIVLVANFWAALLFSTLWFTETKPVPWDSVWQPVLIGFLYILGQSLTFLALEHGDVSVAAPVLSTKIVAVAVLLVAISGERLSTVLWAAVVMAMGGIILVQRTDQPTQRDRLLWSIAFALAAATTFALFDVLVQDIANWAPKWGSGHFLPILFWVGALASLAYLPLIDHSKWKTPGLKLPLFTGTLCIGLQALCIVCTLAYFGDAARVNVVYALRGLWGVVLAWMFASRFDMQEQHLSRNTMLTRLMGAILLTAAVIMALVFK